MVETGCEFEGSWKVPTRDFIPAPAVSVSARKIAAELWKFASMTGGSWWRYGLFHQLGLKIATFSVAATLQIELVEDRNRIKELEAERRFSRMKLDEERALWIRRERQKMSVIVDRLKQHTIRKKRISKAGYS
ncbi:uncharacterized protein Fot_35914 [Forsythia ovata]|uniref:Uncharacterized protein n=1 Tax=Forsythia ovata TaxID=205694 RepID=A0ABD1SNM9_9LAMI